MLLIEVSALVPSKVLIGALISLNKSALPYELFRIIGCVDALEFGTRRTFRVGTVEMTLDVTEPFHLFSFS